MCEESIRVAVRVRPFNQREKDRQARLIIKMQGKSTFITDPKAPNEEAKQFSFDYSYWSHDGFTTLPSGIHDSENGSSIYASQQKVFNDLGRDVLKNAFEGFNCSLFAYGQTGSGKSYSMIGYGANRGIIPIACDELFRQIQNTKDTSTRYQVTLSMMEIYNEQVRDLLTKDFPKGGLIVRQHPTSGAFYAKDLRVVPVGNYNDIERRMTEGTENRTIAATNMNATSSRAHTVVTINFDQILKSDNGETKKTSVINLVDLAGSERASSTGATGDRLKESTNINRSLMTLGNVISALADISSGSKRKIVIPYRESVLTKLLQNALGGNSKTVMIAALSPADVNYDETLSTLRFADRVKRIKNTVIVNENPIEKLIRELKEENERLKLMIDTGKYNLNLEIKPGMSQQDIELMRKQMEEEILAQIQANQQMLIDSKTPWESKLEKAQQDEKVMSNVNQIKVAYLANLNEDPMLSYVICHQLNKDEVTIGNRNTNILLTGLSISERHAVIYRKNESHYEIQPSEMAAKIKVNGYNLAGSLQLKHKDRLLFGASHLYVFIDPINETSSSNDLPANITWEFAQKEIAKAKGYSLGNNLTVEQEDVQEKILSLLPLLSDVNAISEELNKYRVFEIVLMPVSSWDGVAVKGSKVMIKMRNLLNQNAWFWDDVKFTNRTFIIKEHYQKFLDGEEEILYIAKEDDPFWEPVEELLLGTANVFLQSLAYALDFSDEVCIVDHKGLEQGRISINLAPCSPNGKILTEEHYVDQPEELLGKAYSFQIALRFIEINDERHNKGLRIRYKVFNELEFTETKIFSRGSVCANIKQSRIVTIPSVDQNWLDFFQDGCIIFQIYVIQEETKLDTVLFKMTTRDLKKIEQKQENSNFSPAVHPNSSLPGDSKLKSELTLLQRKYHRLEQKEKRIQQLCRDWEHNHEYQKFYKAISAVAFSSGTKLKASASVINNENPIDIYLFGCEEQDYLLDLENHNTDRQKFWDEFYRKAATKQRRNSLSYRISGGRTSMGNLHSITRETMNSLKSLQEESYQSHLPISESRPSLKNIEFKPKHDVKKPAENGFAMKASSTTIQSEKRSTTCSIQ